MSTNQPNTPLQQAPYLRIQRYFPDDEVSTLAKQVDQAYIDIAGKVNQRIIGNYPLNFLSITGERWYFQGSTPQQSLRQVYQFTAAGNIPHGLTWADISMISPKSYGSYTDGTNWYGVIYATSNPITNQVSFYVTDIDIVVLLDGTAPAITSGIIVLEYISINA